MARAGPRPGQCFLTGSEVQGGWRAPEPRAQRSCSYPTGTFFFLLRAPPQRAGFLLGHTSLAFFRDREGEEEGPRQPDGFLSLLGIICLLRLL